MRGRGFRARLRVGGSTAAAITVRLQRAYNPRIDPRRHRPSNLLSAQFQRTMEFTARRYAALLSALRLAARLMRLRLPTGGGETSGVKTKVLLLTNKASLHYQTVAHRLPALTRKCVCHRLPERLCRLPWMLLRLLKCR